MVLEGKYLKLIRHGFEFEECMPLFPELEFVLSLSEFVFELPFNPQRLTVEKLHYFFEAINSLPIFQ